MNIEDERKAFEELLEAWAPPASARGEERKL